MLTSKTEFVLKDISMAPATVPAAMKDGDSGQNATVADLSSCFSIAIVS